MRKCPTSPASSSVRLPWRASCRAMSRLRRTRRCTTSPRSTRRSPTADRTRSSIRPATNSRSTSPKRCSARFSPSNGRPRRRRAATEAHRMDIRAAILWEQKQPLSVEPAVLDPPGPGEVLVEVKAAGVCHSDLHPARGDWPAKPPIVLGHEGAGIVREVGPSVTRVAPGDHVILCSAPPCGECPPCREGRAVLCDRLEKITFRNRLPSGASRLHARQQDIAPFLGTACFSSFVVVPEEGAIPIPRDLPFEALATLGCAVLTGVGAVMNAAKVQSGARVA